jgi:serine protease Do
VSAEGLGFAIPVNDAQPIITQLMNGSIQRPMLGVNVVEVSKDEANYEMVSPGLYIQALTQNGPAMKAGLQAGDQLESVDGAKISAVADLRNVIAKHKVGDTVVVKVYRSSDKQEHTYNVTFDSSANLSTSTSTTNQP